MTRISIKDVDKRNIEARYDPPHDQAIGLYLFGHGAGAGMEHRFMTALTKQLIAHGIGVLRFQFPYMQEGKRRPDPSRVLEATVQAVAAWALEHEGDFPPGPWFAGGKSMGGRITARVAAAGELSLRFSRLVFVGFPLHAAGKPGRKRVQTLRAVGRPMLFLQGDRDALADIGLIRDVVDELGDRAALHVVAGADHGFSVLKRSGRSNDEILVEIAERFRAEYIAHRPRERRS